MLNVSLALSALVSTIILFKLQLSINTALKVLLGVVSFTYITLKYSSLGKYLKPSRLVHTIFVISYLISAAGTFIPLMALGEGGDPIGAALLFYIALSIACVLQVVGLFVLLFDVVFPPRSYEK